MMDSEGALWKNPAVPDLRHRVLYTGLLLLLFRLLADIPVLNVDEERLDRLLADNPLIGTVDLFAGGEVLKHFSVVAAGIFPYLVALMLVKGATWVVPSLRELRRQGEQARKRLEFYAKLTTIPLAFVFAWGICQYLAQQTGLFPGHIHWFTAASFFPSLRIVGLVTLGSVVSIWIIDLITKKGVGTGEDVILLVGSSLSFVQQLRHIVQGAGSTTLAIQRLAFAVMAGLVAVVVSIYLVKTARRIPIRSGSGRSPSSSTYLPLLLNRGGILPVAAAMGLLTLLQFGGMFLVSQFGAKMAVLGRGLGALTTPENGWYWVTLGCLIVLFTYVCNFSGLWQPFSNEKISLAEQLRQNGPFIPGVRPGSQTEEYLSRIVARITLPAGLGLALFAAGLPYVILRFTHQNVLVTVLSLIVVVKTVEGLRDKIGADATWEAYQGFLRRPKKRP